MSLDLSVRLAEFLSCSSESSSGSPPSPPFVGIPTVALQPCRRPLAPSIARRSSETPASALSVAEIPAFIDPEVWNAAIRPLDFGDWGERSETEFLLNLYRATGGRWVVVHDRWCERYGARGRTMEQLKSRFVKVIAKMIDLKLSASGNGNLRYNAVYDSQRRNFIDRTWKRDPLVIDQTQRIIKDLFKKKKVFGGARPLSGGAGFGAGVSLASQLARAPDLTPEMNERIRFICNSLAIDLPANRGYLRSLRIQRTVAVVHKLLHSLLILKDVIAFKRLPPGGASLVGSLNSYAGSLLNPGQPVVGSAALPGGIRVRVQPGGASQARSSKKRKTDGSVGDTHSNN